MDLPRIEIKTDGSQGTISINGVKVPATFFIGVEKEPGQVAKVTIRLWAESVEVIGDAAVALEATEV